MCSVLVAPQAELAPVKQGLRNTPDAEARGSPRHVVRRGTWTATARLWSETNTWLTGPPRRSMLDQALTTKWSAQVSVVTLSP